MTWTGEPAPGGWVYTHDTLDARIVLDYIVPRGNGLEAWVELRVGDNPIPVASGTRNLMSPTAAAPFVEKADPDRESNVDWAAGLDQAFFETVDAWREGAATVDLSAVEPTELEFYVDPLIEQGGNTRLIAPGGSGKSLLAMAIALTVATGSRRFLGLDAQRTGPVLYLDWETNQETHARRIQALCAAAGVDAPGRELIWYRNEALPLYKTMQAVHRAADRCGAVMLVVDSRVMAAGASGQSSGEDSTLNLNTALREIGRPAVIVDHKAKENIEKGKKGGYGSVFNQNLARMEWEFTKYQKLGENDHVFVLSLEKQNNVGHLPPLGFRLTTEGGKQGVTAARFRPVRPSSVVDPAPRDSLAEDILDLFATDANPMTVGRIAEITGAGSSTVRAALNRNKAMFENVGSKKQGLWRPTEDYAEGAVRDDGVQSTLDQLEEIPVDDDPVSVNGGEPEPEREPEPFREPDDVEVF